MRPVYTLQKILREYNIGIADNIPAALTMAVIKKRNSGADPDSILIVDANDITIEFLRIAKDGNSIAIKLQHDYRNYNYRAKKDPLTGWEDEIDLQLF